MPFPDTCLGRTLFRIVSCLAGWFKSHPGGLSGYTRREMSNSFISEVRLDKWLQVARIFKTRSQATQACTAGHVKVNGAVSRPHRTVKPADRLEIERDDWPHILIVEEVRDKPVPKAEARRLYTDMTPPPPPLDPLAELLRRPPVSRAKGSGRPTKRDRRAIKKLTE